VQINTPQDAVNAGIGYLSEDRKRYGVALGLSVADNSVLSNLDAYSGRLFVRQREINQTASQYVEKLNIRTPSIRQLVRNLSGGNQQKLILARELSLPHNFLVASQPTRGLDVGATEFVYRKLLEEKRAARRSSSSL